MVAEKNEWGSLHNGYNLGNGSLTNDVQTGLLDNAYLGCLCPVWYRPEMVATCIFDFHLGSTLAI